MGFHTISSSRTRGAFHLVRTHLGGGGIKSPINLLWVLHEKNGEGVQIACEIAYKLNGRPQRGILF